MHAQLVETVSELLRERLGPTSAYAQSLIDIQVAYINTNHPAFTTATTQQLHPQPASRHVHGHHPQRVRQALTTAHLLTLADDVYSIPQPRSAEPTGSSATANGSSVTVSKEDDGATDSADEFPSGAAAPSGVATKTTRSVSATLQHERERPRGAGAKASPRSSNASDSRVSTHRSSHPNASQQQQQHNAHGSPQTARESFLTYIFGQNGPGPIGASSAVSAASVVSAVGSGSAYGVGGSADGVPASGRDVSGGADVLLRTGFLAGRHDGNSAAYDMKSLGKHIEAVRSSISHAHFSPEVLDGG